MMTNVVITGNREGQDAEDDLSLKNHVAHKRVKLPKDVNGHIPSPQAFRALLDYLSTLTEGLPDHDQDDHPLSQK
jgi:hypothetical protein